MAKKGDVNVVGMLMLLNAEEATFRSSQEATRKLFDQAIVSLSHGGFIAFAAIANERAGDAMDRFQDVYWTEHYYKKAGYLYNTWGSVLMEDQLRTKYTQNADKSESKDTQVLNVRGRTRFDDVHVLSTSLEQTPIEQPPEGPVTNTKR